MSVSQLLSAGLSRQEIKWRTAIGRLFRIHRGVYAVGHPELTDHGRWKAATLAVPNSVLSHRSAAELWALLRPSHGVPQLTVPYPASPGRRPAIRIVRSRTLAPNRTTSKDGIPVTTVPRTLADLGAAVEPHLVRRAIRQAEFLGLDPGVAERLVVELDSWTAHRGRQAFEDDRARDLPLHRRGYRVRRFSIAQITRERDRSDHAGAGIRRRLVARRSLPIRSNGWRRRTTARARRSS